MRENFDTARGIGRDVRRGLHLYTNCGSGARAFGGFVPGPTGQNDGHRAYYARSRHNDKTHCSAACSSRNRTCGRHSRNSTSRQYCNPTSHHFCNRARRQNAPSDCASADRCACRSDGPEDRSTGFRKHGRSSGPTLP